MTYKTPGVYTEEVALLPPSVAPVATAIPAFIGYTKDDKGSGSEGLRLKPTRIISLLEYRALFETAPTPGVAGGFIASSYQVLLNPDDSISEIRQFEGTTNKRFHLYNALRHYFDNGGGPCYIVSIGSYSDSISLGDDTSHLLGGLKVLEKFDEPTLIVAPDAVELDIASLGSFQAKALAQCNNLKDRFCIFDLHNGDKQRTPTNDPIGDFRNGIGSNHLMYGSAYSPWLISIYSPPFQFDKITIARETTPTTLLTNVQMIVLGQSQIPVGLVANATALAAEYFSIHEEVNTLKNNFKLPTGSNPLHLPFKAFFNELVNTFVNKTPLGTVTSQRSEFLEVFSFLQSCATIFVRMENPVRPFIASSIASLKQSQALIGAITQFIAIEKNASILTEVMPASRNANTVNSEYAALFNTTDWVAWPAADKTINDTNIPANTSITVPAGPNIRARGGDVLRGSNFLAVVDLLLTAAEKLYADALLAKEGKLKQLLNDHPWFKGLVTRFQFEMGLVPPSGAVAGIYATTDLNRGVWKAPANISLNAVIQPAFKISDFEQEELNLPTTGKAINAIRSFTGKGILVWGARTLAGNDNEWRFVPVRRFFNFVEESTKKATEPFVFEPNNANTWVRVRAMLENFLFLQWRAGALVGAKAEQSFYVKIGLGETMTSEDILQGFMIVEIGMAVVRPAEFIILRFSQKMQES